MTIKILCDCDTKFAFDIEPINGRMPSPIACPGCGRDATATANQIIAEQLALRGVVPAPQSGPVPIFDVPPVSAAPQPATFVAEAAPAMETCSKHPSAPAAANCVVCQKPICLDCMTIFGYLCSAYCKGLAARKNISVPVYEGMRTERMHAETAKGNKLLIAVCSVAVAFLGLFIWYNFFGAKPKLAWQVESSSGRFFHSQWVGRDKIVAVATDKAVLLEAGSGKQVWETKFKSDEKAGQQSTTIFGKEDADLTYFSSLDVRAHVAGNDLWVVFPKKAVRIDLASGNRKLELPLPEPIEDATFSADAFLGIAKPAEGKHVLSRVDFGSGQLKSIVLTQVLTRVAYPNNRIPTVGSGYADAGRASDSFGSAQLMDDRREYFLSGSSVVHVNIRLLEERFVRVEAMRQQKTSIIDSGTARASQGLEAAEEMLNEMRRSETGGVRIEDESRYQVNLRRPFGGGAAWAGEVFGPPAFFPLRNVDLLVAGKTVYAFNKSGQKIWESKISFPLAPRFIEGLTDEYPALEHGSKLYFFDQGNLIAFDSKNGQVAWRLQSVGISFLKADQAGKLYVATTTAGVDQIKYSEEISINEKIRPVLMKVDPATGAIIWQKDRVGQEIFVSGKYLYATQSQISGLDRFSAMTGGGGSAPVHSRVYRVDPDNGKELWEFYRPKPPQGVEPRDNRIQLQYGNEILMVNYFSL